MNKIAKTVLMTGTALCAAGVVLSTAGYFAGGKRFHIYFRSYVCIRRKFFQS